MNADPQDVTGRIEHALEKVLAAEPLERRLREAGEVRRDLVSRDDWLDDLVARSLLNEEERALLDEAHAAIRRAIDVDDFAPTSAVVAASTERAA